MPWIFQFHFFRSSIWITFCMIQWNAFSYVRFDTFNRRIIPNVRFHRYARLLSILSSSAPRTVKHSTVLRVLDVNLTVLELRFIIRFTKFLSFDGRTINDYQVLKCCVGFSKSSDNVENLYITYNCLTVPEMCQTFYLTLPVNVHFCTTFS